MIIMAGKFFMHYIACEGHKTILEMRILTPNECRLLSHQIKLGFKEHPEEYINEVND